MPYSQREREREQVYTFSPPESPNRLFRSIEPNRWVGFLVAFQKNFHGVVSGSCYLGVMGLLVRMKAMVESFDKVRHL